MGLNGDSSMIYYMFLGNTSHQNPIYLVYCCWQLISNKDTKHTEKGKMSKQKGVRSCYGNFRNSFLV